MQYGHLPGLGHETSRIGAGCWTIGGPAVNGGKPVGWGGVDEQSAYGGLLRARELGVTFFDTADVYGMGRSERLIGRMLAETGDRDDLVISTKGGYFAGTGRHPYEARQLEHQFATSLENLGTDYVDIYHLHSDDFGHDDRYLATAVDAVHRLRDQGMVRAIGMRAPHRFAVQWAADDTHPHFSQARRWLALLGAVQPDVLTLRHNVLQPPYEVGETDLFGLARVKGIGIILKQVLGQGLLLGTYRPGGFAAGDHRSGKKIDPELLQLIEDTVRTLAGRFGDDRSSLARVAVQYALQPAPDAVALLGFRDAAQISTTVVDACTPLTGEDIDFVRKAASLVHEKMAQLHANGSAYQSS